MINTYISIKNDLHFQLLFSYLFKQFFYKQYDILQKIRQEYTVLKLTNSLFFDNKKEICVLLRAHTPDCIDSIKILYTVDKEILESKATRLDLSIDQCRKKDKIETYLKLLDI